jgi:hypothetical protein
MTVVVTETNTGDDPLTGVSVTGSGSCTAFTGGATTLAVAASADFTCTFTANASGSWTATGHGIDSLGNAVSAIGETTSGAFTTAGVPKVGVFRSGYLWVLDANGNRTFDGTGPGLDIVTAFGGIAGDIPITGDWSGTGTTKIGIYRPSTGQFILDFNDNGAFDGGLADRVYQLLATPVAGDIPVTGDWSGSGTTKIGIYRPSTGQWFIDLNGDGLSDFVTNFGGLPGDVPVTGDWTGTGITKIGIFRSGFFWLLDLNGNGTFDAADVAFPFGGLAGDVPVVGDWNGSGTSKVGLFRSGFFWVLDTNGDHQFTTGDAAFAFGGLTGDVPVVGKWRRP